MKKNIKIGEIYEIDHIFPKHNNKPYLTEILDIDNVNGKVKILSGMFLDIPMWVEIDRFYRKEVGYNAKYYGIKKKVSIFGFVLSTKIIMKTQKT